MDRKQVVELKIVIAGIIDFQCAIILFHELGHFLLAKKNKIVGNGVFSWNGTKAA